MKCEILKDIYLVAGGRYNFTHPLNCNVYLIDGGKELALIDSGAGLDSSLINSIQELGFNPKNISFVINTHSHWDHARGNKDIKEISKCKIAIHEHGVNVLENGPWPYNLKFDPVRVDLKLKDGDEISVGSYKLQVIHTPGHTLDSICILLRHEEKKVLFSGDTVQAWGGLGVTSAQTDFTLYKKSVERIASLKVDVLLPGHGIFILSNAYEHVDFLLEKISGVWEDFILFPHPLLARLRSRWLSLKK